MDAGVKVGTAPLDSAAELATSYPHSAIPDFVAFGFGFEVGTLVDSKVVDADLEEAGVDLGVGRISGVGEGGVTNPKVPGWGRRRVDGPQLAKKLENDLVCSQPLFT